MSSELTAARYGKTKVRGVFRIATLRLGTSHTEADKLVLAATDSSAQEHHILLLAKTSPGNLSAEKFALHLVTFFVSKYAHIAKAFVAIEQLRRSRIHVDGEEPAEGHLHSFYRDGNYKRVVKVEVDGSAGKDKLVGKVTAGINDLLVVKSTGFASENFYRDEYTTLVEVNDRIFSTSVGLSYTFAPISIRVPTNEKTFEFVVPGKRGKKATLEAFVGDEGASVQAALYKMAQRVVAENASVNSVSYALPNKHYIPVDMRYLNTDNLTPYVEHPFTFIFDARPRVV
ncbi:hypothetical protein D9613_011947 [Agrocybe pediades]|uniref:Uricase n=1 Tax=Agrocybe pediades TaxID=84607 RepID=A0A8H4QF39_9AGAR|nr:hypothetical protein D9613_011947 [Agrocybe pediades]